jgi:hypothetical protein
MIRWYFEKFMQAIGYRKFWYFPSRRMPMSDFWIWKFRPDLPEGVYDGERKCTCHPDDNPPVPCAKQYALSECREVSKQCKQ